MQPEQASCRNEQAVRAWLFDHAHQMSEATRKELLLLLDVLEQPMLEKSC